MPDFEEAGRALGYRRAPAVLFRVSPNSYRETFENGMFNPPLAGWVYYFERWMENASQLEDMRAQGASASPLSCQTDKMTLVQSA